MERWSSSQVERFERWFYPRGAYRVAVTALLLGAIALSGLLVHATGGSRFVYADTMYIPILLAALFFRIPGGIVAAVLGGLVLGPSMPIDTVTGEMQTTVNWLFRMGVFSLVGGLAGVVVSLLDRRMKQVKWLNKHGVDPAVPNRLFLAAALADLMAREGEDRDLVVTILHLNNYPQLADAFGLNAVEALAEQISTRIKPLLVDAPISQLLPHIFGVMVPSSPSEADFMAPVLDVIRQPLETEGVPVLVDVSVGLAHYPKHGREPATLIRKASLASHVAQARGLRVLTYSEPAEDVIRAVLATLGKLPTAIAEKQLVFDYQPIISTESGRAVGAEALMRWHHPSLGLIPPSAFISLAENTSLVYPLHEFTLQATTQEFTSWKGRVETLHLAVNLSARLLRDASWLDRVDALLRTYGLGPHQLVLEITESAIMTDMKESLKTMERIREVGIALAIDDFGTGSSALSYLKRFPVKYIKIDQSFTKGLTSDENDQQIVKATIALGHSMGLTIVAEGVETEETYRWLADHGCDLAQGFWMCKPMSGAEIVHWLDNSQGSFLSSVDK